MTDTDELTVSREQVSAFLYTLQEYSESCAESRRVVEEAIVEVSKYAAEVKKNVMECAKNNKKVQSELKTLKK